MNNNFFLLLLWAAFIFSSGQMPSPANNDSFLLGFSQISEGLNMTKSVTMTVSTIDNCENACHTVNFCLSFLFSDNTNTCKLFFEDQDTADWGLDLLVPGRSDDNP